MCVSALGRKLNRRRRHRRGWRHRQRSRQRQKNYLVAGEGSFGPALPALKLRKAESVREGQLVAFTGFPIGGALGFSPVTHRGMVSSITPIALPAANARQVNEKLVRLIKSGPFNIFQLDATAYPGNSGSPVFDASSGEVIGIINMVFIKVLTVLPFRRNLASTAG